MQFLSVIPDAAQQRPGIQSNKKLDSGFALTRAPE
jgi:hypothetical protein